MSESLGCARPTGKVVGADEEIVSDESIERKEKTMGLRPGMKAPDFEAPAYHRGEFTQVKLSDSLGHWALLCFYPGDFTFV